MSEKKNEKPVAAAAGKEGTKEKSGQVVKAREEHKQEKIKWTLERCMKYARRYGDEATWASASPSSYKSACAHGWKDSCLAGQKAGGQVVPGKFPKKGDGASPNRKAA